MEDPFDCSLMTLDLTTECPKNKSEKLSGRVDAWDLGEEEMIDGSRKARPSSWWRPWKKDERPEVSQVIEIPSSGGPLGAKLYDLGGDCMTPISLDEGGRCETPVGCIGRPLPMVLQVPVAEIVAPGAIPSPVNSEAKAVPTVGPYGGVTGITSKPFSLDPDGRQEQRAIEANPTLVSAFDE